MLTPAIQVALSQLVTNSPSLYEKVLDFARLTRNRPPIEPKDFFRCSDRICVGTVVEVANKQIDQLVVLELQHFARKKTIVKGIKYDFGKDVWQGAFGAARGQVLKFEFYHPEKNVDVENYLNGLGPERRFVEIVTEDWEWLSRMDIEVHKATRAARKNEPKTV